MIILYLAFKIVEILLAYALLYGAAVGIVFFILYILFKLGKGNWKTHGRTYN